MKVLRLFSRYIVGIVFIFSGFVKAVDPLGSAYKFGDYFHAFGLDFLDAISLPLGILLAALEFVLGLVLILGYQKKIAYWVLFVFMSFFTLLTFILGLTNPVSDCGCFGDAIILTNWETFFKNVVLMVFVMVLFYHRNNGQKEHTVLFETGVIILLFVSSVGLSTYCLRHLPLIDFRPYSVGMHIPEGMEIPEDAPRDEYRTILYYKNLETGKEEEFTIENYPKDTTKYSFVTSDSKLVSKGYEPPIHDFAISHPDGYDITDEILNRKSYTLMMVSYNLEEAETGLLIDANEWFQLQKFASDFDFLPVTASSDNVLNEKVIELGLDYRFYSADEIMLKTTVRSNPGMILIKNGTIVAKWSYRDFPTLSEWNADWPEVIEQYLSEQDPEIMQLIEEGYMDEMDWNVIDFDKSANPLYLTKFISQNKTRSWLILILTVSIVLFLLQILPKKKSSIRRV